MDKNSILNLKIKRIYEYSLRKAKYVYQMD